MTPEESLKTIAALEAAATTKALHVPEPTPAQEAPPEVEWKNILHKVVSDALTIEDIPDTLKQAFIRSMVGGAPFTHTFRLLDGTLEVQFKEPLAAISRKYNRILKMITDADTKMQFILLSYLARVESIEKGGRGKVLFSGWEFDPSFAELSPADVDVKIQDTFEAEFSELGNSLRRLLPELWVIFSGVWMFFIRNEVPKSF